MHVFLGVDGGGSHCSLALLDSSRRVLATSTSGPTNWNSVGKPRARENLESGLLQLVRSSGLEPSSLTVRACLCLSGFHGGEDAAVVTEWVRLLFPGSAVLVLNDVAAALASGTGGVLQGVVCIAGTGMCCYGRNSEGQEWSTGGMGPMLGDRGSGYALGSEMLAACARANDGRIGFTSLLEDLLERRKVKSFEELIGWRYDQKCSWADIAALAPVVLQHSENGDPVSREIVKANAKEMANAIAVVIEKLWGSEQIQLVLTGSLWNSLHYRTFVLEELRKRVINKVVPILPEVDAAVGAALLAMNSMTDILNSEE